MHEPFLNSPCFWIIHYATKETPTYVKVLYHGHILLNCLFLAICFRLKVTQFFFKVVNLPGYMVGRCGENFVKSYYCTRHYVVKRQCILPQNLSNFICSIVHKSGPQVRSTGWKIKNVKFTVYFGIVYCSTFFKSIFSFFIHQGYIRKVFNLLKILMN